MKITDEVRAAVLAEQCEELGHDLNMQNTMIGGGQTGDNRVKMQVGCLGDRAPHIVCGRCNLTFVIIETGVIGYDAAEQDLIDRLGDDPLAHMLGERRARRLGESVEHGGDGASAGG